MYNLNPVGLRISCEPVLTVGHGPQDVLNCAVDPKFLQLDGVSDSLSPSCRSSSPSSPRLTPWVSSPGSTRRKLRTHVLRDQLPSNPSETFESSQDGVQVSHRCREINVASCILPPFANAPRYCQKSGAEVLRNWTMRAARPNAAAVSTILPFGGWMSQ